MVVLHGKCVLAGESTVGKSAVSQAFVADGTTFPKSYTMTPGVELLQKMVQVGKSGQDSVDMIILDSAGKEVFSDICESSWEKVGMFAVMFDLSSTKSFANCQKWLKKLKQFFEPGKTIPGILIGNKSDLFDRRKVTSEEATLFAEQNSLTYFECSAKEYKDIDVPFKWLSQKFLDLYEESHDLIQQFE